jgi:predicted component of type VI protein secretion system
VGSVQPESADPWAALEQDSATFQAPSSSLADAYRSTLVEGRGRAVDEDPFSDWGFESTLGPGAGLDDAADRPSVAAPAPIAGAGDLSGLFRGLGLDPADIGPLSDGELEGIGQVVRMALTGLLDLYAAKMGLQRELGAEDRTMMAVKNNNPLKADWPVEVRLRYLLGGRASATGFIGPDRALTELLAELRAHDVAASAGARAVVQGALGELSPAALRKQAPPGTRLFEAARLWETYARIHGQEGADMEAWVQRLFERHFADTYLREVRRLLREESARTPGGSS